MHMHNMDKGTILGDDGGASPPVDPGTTMSDTGAAGAAATTTTEHPSDQPGLPSITILDFPKPTKQHILNCSYPSWYQLYKKVSPKARVIPLSKEFIAYLRADGIVLPHDDLLPQAQNADYDNINSAFSSDIAAKGTLNGGNAKGGNEGDDGEDEEDVAEDPSLSFLPVHKAIKEAIAELGGKVAPKLSWSAPKDASFILNNSLECRTPSDIYLLFKSSDFISFDLKHAFDDTLEQDAEEGSEDSSEPSCATMDYHIVLRKWIDFIPSVEFRCFVRHRNVVAITQRDLNHYDFLEAQSDNILDIILDFFDENLKETFQDSDFVFDVYIPSTSTHSPRVWLIDINPFAPRTDPLTFSWTELLNINSQAQDFEPELRLVKKDDPEAYGFYGGRSLGSGGQYGAYKMPKEVVDAGNEGPAGIAEFATRWKEIIEKLESDTKNGGQSESDSDSDSEADEEDDDGSEEEEEEETLKAQVGEKAAEGKKP